MKSFRSFLIENSANSTDFNFRDLHSIDKEKAMAAVRDDKFGTHPYHFSYALQSPHEEVAMAAFEHENFATHPDHIISALYSPHKEVQMAALKHSSFGTHQNHIIHALNSEHEEVGLAVLKHSDFLKNPENLQYGLEAVRNKNVRMAAVHYTDMGLAKRVAHVHADDYSTWAVDTDGRLHGWGSTRYTRSLPFKLSDEAWLEFATRMYDKTNERIYPKHIRKSPTFNAIRTMHRLAKP